MLEICSWKKKWFWKCKIELSAKDKIKKLGIRKPYIYASFTVIDHGDWGKITFCYIFPTTLTISMLIKHRANTPVQFSLQPVSKETPVFDIDKYTGTGYTYCKANNIPYSFIFRTKEQFYSCFRTSYVQRVDLQHSIFCKHIYLPKVALHY